MPDKIHLDDWREIEEYINAIGDKIKGLDVETEMTQDADEARQLDVDRLDLKEEEEYINEKLEPGRYIDGREVAEIHQKYEKHIGQLQNELKKAKEKGDPAKVDKINDDINKLKESRNKELQRLCDEAPKYNRSAVRSMMTQQLRYNDAGRVGGEIKIYRKEKGHDSLLVTTYGKNKVGEFNKFLRKHDEKMAELKGRKAGEHARSLGHSTREFLRGDAESMFKGSISMGLHAFLFLMNKAAQAGSKSAQWALYAYARNKLTMDDMEAMQNVLNDMSKENVASNKDGTEQKDWNGTIEPMDFSSPDLPPFEDMELCDTYTTDPDVRVSNMSYIDDNGTRREGYIYRGTDDDIRQYLSNMGLPDDVVDAELAENAEKVEALGLGKILPMDFSDPNLPTFNNMLHDADYFEPMACYDAEHDIMAVHVQRIEGEQDIVQGKVLIGNEDDIRRYFADKGMSDAEIDAQIAENAAKVEALGLNPEKVHGQGYEEYMLDEDRKAYEEYLEKTEEDIEEDIEEDVEEGTKESAKGEPPEVVLAPGKEDVMDLLNGKSDGNEKASAGGAQKQETGKKRLYDTMDAILMSDDGKGLADVVAVQPGAGASYVAKERGGDDYGDR